MGGAVFFTNTRAAARHACKKLPFGCGPSRPRAEDTRVVDARDPPPHPPKERTTV
uniref:Uncharacterized protein n=1 Tax=Human betaherpesvirus 6 TaxID=10368 RepID=A0A5P9S5B9_9BETA|nr:hypothetical protein [Human betaherpesvirus 6]